MNRRLVCSILGGVLMLFLGGAGSISPQREYHGAILRGSVLKGMGDSREGLYGALLPGSLARGKTVFKKNCKSCHASPVRFKKYKKSKINAAIKSQPTMVGIKLTPQKMVDLVFYFSKIK